jgi:hypothetical protein
MNLTANQGRTLILLIFALLYSNLLTAQQAPKVKFGKPDAEELKMTVYDKDTGAVAVILYDNGEFSLDNFNFTRHTKIKILKKEGYQWANNSFTSRSNYIVKGFTHNLENGQIVSTKLDKEQIFPEQYATGRFNVKFTMPNVKVGSVIEFRITYPGLPGTWNFQLPIPVIWSELYIPESSYFSFNKATYGYENIGSLGTNHWYAKDVSAVREEPFLSTLYNFVSKMEFELKNVTFPGVYESFTNDWEDVNRILSEDEDFGGKLKLTGYMKDIVNEIKAKNLPPYERMKCAYAAIQKHMKWNEENYIYTTKMMSQAFKERTGNTAEINLMLIALLRELDLNVNPVVLSTRGNGVLHPAHPTLDKLNYVVANVKIDTSNFVMDATDPFLPLGTLPYRCLNGDGRIFETKNYKGRWYSLKPQMASSRVTYMDLKLSSTGEATGTLTKESKGYAAHDLREEIEELAGFEKYMENYQDNHKEIKITSPNIENLDSIYKSVKIKMNVEMNDNIVVTSDKIFFNPLFLEQMTENPFKSEKRTYPVDFGYLRDNACILRIEIPVGYAVSEVPKSVVLKSPDNSIRFIYSVSTLNNFISLTCKFNIGKSLYLPNEYEILRELYNQIVTKEAEQIVLKKI